MESYAFPADLVNDVIARWSTQMAGVFKRPPLPSRAQLQNLLEVAYLASHETDEARPICFTVCCTPVAETVQRFQQETLVEAWNFAASRPYDVQELKRLAVTTDIDSSALWVQFPNEEAGPLRIKGLLNLGTSWAHARDARALHYEALPDALTVRVDGPGSLSVYQGQIALSALASGRIRASRFTLANVHGIHALLDEGHGRLSRLVMGPAVSPTRMAQDFEWTAYLNVLLAIINAVRQRGHGGALVLASRQSSVASPEGTLVRTKYSMGEPASHLADHYVTLMTKRHTLADRQWKQEEQDLGSMAALEPVVPSLTELRLAYNEVRDANQSLAEACNFVGHLAGTDGAIVLRTDLALLGFGAEILFDRIAPAKVYEVTSMTLSDPVPLDSEEFGMRHRSAMRLCAADPDVAVFVVSQDGGVSLVFNHQGRVFFRRNISTTNATMAFS